MSANPQSAGSLDGEWVKLTCDSIRHSVTKLRTAVPDHDELTHRRLSSMENSATSLESAPDVASLFALVNSVESLRSLYPAGR